MRLRFLGGVAMVVAGAMVAGCGGSDGGAGAGKAKIDDAAMVKQAHAVRAANAAKVHANELGQIPVIMFHRVIAKPAGPDDRTPAQFRADLERLAKDGYVPITAADYVQGEINIPAGKHPVVLTFDDSSPSQLTLSEVGVPAPDTAVAILQETAKKYPGFRPVATFYVTGDMFGKTTPEEKAQMLIWLKENGFDVGNHTLTHMNMRGRSQKDVTHEIAADQQLVTSLTGQRPITLALPYGNQPKVKDWALTGTEGATTYKHAGVFLAGYTPALAPFDKNFDPEGIPRIRAMDKKGDCVQFCSVAWLDWLAKNADQRYTSDGDPRTVAYPKFKNPFLAKRAAAWAVPY